MSIHLKVKTTSNLCRIEDYLNRKHKNGFGGEIDDYKTFSDIYATKNHFALFNLASFCLMCS